jgi:hypothetical protein
MIKLRNAGKPSPKPTVRGKPPEGKKVSFTIPRAALALWYFAEAADGNRKNLQHIHIELEVTHVGKTKHVKAHAVATDGHRLMHVWWEPKKGERFAEKVWLNAVAVERHLKEATGGKGGSIFARGRDFEYTVIDQGEKFVLVDSSGRSSVAFVIPEEEWDYPRWRDVMPRRDDNDSNIPQIYGVDLNYVDDLRKYLEEFNGKSWNGSLGIKINYTNPPMGPMLLIPYKEEGTEVEIEYALRMGKGASMEYIVMPMRVD